MKLRSTDWIHLESACATNHAISTRQGPHLRLGPPKTFWVYFLDYPTYSTTEAATNTNRELKVMIA